MTDTVSSVGKPNEPDTPPRDHQDVITPPRTRCAPVAEDQYTDPAWNAAA